MPETKIIEKAEWLSLRELLKGDYGYSGKWERPIEGFRTRIENRYFIPISKVKELSLKGEGFTIVTLQCVLIEMFAAFRYGMIHNHRKATAGPAYEYKWASDCLYIFLHNDPMFQNHFYSFTAAGEKITDYPYAAKDFYDEVRCGLVHEARTKGKWLINVDLSSTTGDRMFLKPDTLSGGVSIDRNILNKQLHAYFLRYMDELKEDTGKGELMRRFFARKLDHLFEIDPDPENFEWWEDR